MNKRISRTLLVILGLLVAWAAAGRGRVSAGSLDPPAPPGPTMKTLDQVEPRVPVQSLPGAPDAVHVISAPGSYYLTGNVIGQTGKSGIFINSGDVSLDLNGFNVHSERTEGDHAGITGIQVQPYFNNISVFNGTVSGWNQIGVNAPDYNVLVRDILAFNNAWEGIRVWGGTVADCVSQSNGTGIRLEGPGLVANCEVRGNGDGIVAGEKVAIRDCVCAANGNGIKVAVSGKVENCKLTDNTTGIYLENGTLVTGSHFRHNYLGIFVYNAGTANHIENNHFEAGQYGIRIDAPGWGNFIARNTVTGAGTAAFDIPPANSWGPIITVTGAGDLSTVPGANHPLANFIF